MVRGLGGVSKANGVEGGSKACNLKGYIMLNKRDG